MQAEMTCFLETVDLLFMKTREVSSVNTCTRLSVCMHVEYAAPKTCRPAVCIHTSCL
jgi:hypothetical protein